jgi:RNA polymerase sigma factor for flagellar operon FliA
LTHAPLVKSVAGWMGSRLPAHIEEADMIASGLVGLIRAAERYDPEQDSKFERYAVTRIKGAMIDELRALDWAPRAVRTRARTIERAMATLEATLGRTPTDEEIAQQIGIDKDELDASLVDISRSNIYTLDEIWTGDDGEQVSLLDRIEDTNSVHPSAAFDEPEWHQTLADAIGRLPERERLAITLYYYYDLTLKEIGAVLGVTESRVSQMHSKAMLRLRACFESEPATAGATAEAA